MAGSALPEGAQEIVCEAESPVVPTPHHNQGAESPGLYRFPHAQPCPSKVHGPEIGALLPVVMHQQFADNNKHKRIAKYRI